uniref:Alkaline exonuclease n=1 Tax=Saimiriine herpesvirus 2 (strain 488) TaxID=10384 RepID=Q80BP0_SHV2C|nr:alkaline exonuclease [Saimiriine gammaherpesvirus 2]
MDLFSEESPINEIGNMDMSDQQTQLCSSSFSHFLKHPKVQHFISTYSELVKMPTIRYVYFYYLFKKIGGFIGNEKIGTYFSKNVCNNIAAKGVPKLADVYKACEKMNLRQQSEICLLIEEVTRGQYLNSLWDALRDGTISSSKFYWATKKQNSTKKIFEPWPIKNDYYVAGPLAFGLRCEEVIKTVLNELICTPKQASCFDCGFMQSPLDGIFGVSLDYCTNVETNKDNLLVFHPDTEVYEIKSRFKYLFDKSECDTLYKKYKELYSNPCVKTLIKFIFSVSRPAIEFVPSGRLPSESDYLLAYDEEWNLRPTKKRKLNASHEMIKKCIEYNSYAGSQIYILSDPAENNGQITVKTKFKAGIFMNPRHTYFYQVALQHRVVQSYIGLSESPRSLGTQKNFIVSSFFRKRHFSDPPVCYIGKKQLEKTVEIPVFIIITPVYIPRSALLETISQAVNFWEESAKEAFTEYPWAPCALFANGDLTP